ncbi:MAG: aspartate aminotransferase family protein [Nitrospirales bacterium]|nr:aspartate aminotransferase family protein [Nitrospirales bacterium]
MSDPTPKSFDLRSLVESRRDETMDLLREHINPKLAKVFRMIGFDRVYPRGKGAYLWDREDRKHLDCLTGYGIFNIGRNHPVLKQAVRDYLDMDDAWKIQMAPMTLPGLLAEKLLSKVPHLQKVQFTNSGTECVEVALKFARCETGRERVLYCERAFHGLTYGSLSLNGCSSFREGFLSLLPGAASVPFGDLDALEEALAIAPTAALFVEAIQGKGVYVANKEYLLGAQELCRRHGTRLVVDEVQTGMGRTGKLFAFQHVEGFEPDMVLVAKSLSGGYVPVGAVLIRDETYEAVFSTLDRCVVHSSTFGQGGLAMACGLATFHVLETEGMMENAADKGRKLLEALRELVPQFELLKEIRGEGMMIGIEFGEPKSFTLKTGWSLIHKADPSLFPQSIIMPLLHDHRVLTQVAGHHVDIIKLLPTLTWTDEDVRWFLDAFTDVLKRCHRFPGPLWTTAKDLVKMAATSRR